MDEATEGKLKAHEDFCDALTALVKAYGNAAAIRLLRTMASMLSDKDDDK